MKTGSTVALWGAVTNSSVWVAHGGTLGYALGLVWVGLAALILLAEFRDCGGTT